VTGVGKTVPTFDIETLFPTSNQQLKRSLAADSQSRCDLLKSFVPVVMARLESMESEWSLPGDGLKVLRDGATRWLGALTSHWSCGQGRNGDIDVNCDCLQISRIMGKYG